MILYILQPMPDNYSSVSSGYGDFKKAMRNSILQFQLQGMFFNHSKVNRHYKMSKNNYKIHRANDENL